MAALRWQQAHADPDVVDAFMQQHDLTRLTSIILANRSLALDDSGQFLNPLLQNLSDPYLLPGTRTAAERVWRAIANREPILVFGDYDTDGITATALLTWVLRSAGALVDHYVPDRIDDGYGLTVAAVNKSIREHRVLITVDCGITSHDAAAAACDRGVDVIITDHHEPGETLPQALAVINPKLHPEISVFQGLAGVGVSFKLCHAFIKYGREHQLGGGTIDLKDGLDLVALGTVADIVPLTGENRCLVKHGMKILCAQRRPGIRALCEVSGLHENVGVSDISFRLAPRINAAGRIGNAEDSLQLLQATGMVDAHGFARALDKYNRKRQTFEERITRAARLKIRTLDLDNLFSIVVADRGWHPGVIGIVASRIAREFQRPTVVLSISDSGEIHGSGRSVGAIDLVTVLGACSGHLLRFGGHPMAAGLAVHPKKLAAFETAFEEHVRLACDEHMDFTPVLDLDGEAQLSELNDQFYFELELIKPFGHCNPAPVLRFNGVEPDQMSCIGANHSRGRLLDGGGNSMQFVAFGRRPRDFPDQPWDVAGIPQINVYKGCRNRQIQVVDVRRAGIDE